MSKRETPVEHLSAVTLVTGDMAASVAFYEALGFVRRYGGPDDAFTSYAIGASFLNVQLVDGYQPGPLWGRAIVWVDDVDAMYERARAAGFEPTTEPSDAPWGERYYHLRDPAGHELSFARPLGR